MYCIAVGRLVKVYEVSMTLVVIKACELLSLDYIAEHDNREADEGMQS